MASFLSLPLELRLQVLQDATTEVSVCNDNYMQQTHSKASHEGFKWPRLQLSLTCKQLADELGMLKAKTPALRFCSLQCCINHLDAGLYSEALKWVTELRYDDQTMTLKHVSKPETCPEWPIDCGTFFVRCSDKLEAKLCAWLVRRGQKGDRPLRICFCTEITGVSIVFNQNGWGRSLTSGKDFWINPIMETLPYKGLAQCRRREGF